MKYLFLLLVLTSGCAGFGAKSDHEVSISPEQIEELIKAARKAGCIVSGIDIDAYLETIGLTCQGK